MDVKLAVCGGDILPVSGEKKFLTCFFPQWLKNMKDMEIRVLGMFGNDDFRYLVCHLDEFEKEGIFTRIDGKLVEYHGWKFWGYNFVPELPFGLKDWVKLDYAGALRPVQYSAPVISSEKGFVFINDIEAFFAQRGTIEEDLEKVKFPDPFHTIVVSHSPPYGTGLDLCFDGRQVGSRSMFNFLLKEQPLVSLHGHIHESPLTSGRWKIEIGNTIAIQPGQQPVLIEISEGKVQSELLDFR
jgi:Icc-related predicted phosphoesterase